MAERRVQRRLAGIVSVDVVGYSRTMGADETGTLTRLQTLRTELLAPRVGEYGGSHRKDHGGRRPHRVPSPVDAVRHAIEVQRDLYSWNAALREDQHIRLQFGINVGDIIIDGDNIYGGGVNVAAQFEGVCDPSEIYLCAAVHDQVTGKIDAAFDDLGGQTLKKNPASRSRGPLLRHDGAIRRGRVTHVWMHPSVQVVSERFERVIGCVHVSGLDMRH